MSISFKTKVVLGFLGIGIVPLSLVSAFLLYNAWQQAYATGGQTLEALHDESSERIEDYFQLVKNQTQERAQAKAIRESMKEFIEAYKGFDPAIVTVDMTQMKDRYAKLAEKTQGMKVEEAERLMPVSPKSLALQYLYMVKNANVIGEKDKMMDAGDGSVYSAAHAKFHPAFKRYVNMFGYYDMMLIDAESGDIIYSEAKEVDFGSNINTGPLASSILAKTVKKAIEGKGETKVVLSDFEPYAPSYGEWAGFVAAPIMDEGRVIGIVAYQIPIEKLAESFKYVKSVGKTADGYLVGEDMKFRSKPMTFESKVGDDVPGYFVERLKKVFQSNYTGLDEWVGGKDGKEKLYGAMQKLNVPDFNWAIVVRIDRDELLADFYKQLYISLGLILLAIAVCVGIGLMLSNVLVKPIQGLARDFDKGQGQVGQNATHMGEAVSSMIAASEETSAQSKVIRQSSNEAAGYVASVTSAIEELNVSIHDISQSIGETNVLIDDAVGKAQKTDEVVRSLGEASKRITEVVSLINDLAEQTNLLALNAAIEAARAGDAGRGFAVVADEVKKLASHTSQATVDIKSQITEIQDVSEQSVVALQAVVEAIHRIRDNATTVSAAVEEQSGVARQIAGSVKEAAGRVQDVDRNMTGIEQAASDTSVAAEQVNQSMGEMTRAVNGMKSDVEGVLDDMGIKA